MSILVTGGLGYIGSHTCVELLNNNYDVVVVDNLYNSNYNVVNSIKQITNKDFKFIESDLCDLSNVENIFKNNNIECVIHLAAYKAVGESVNKPIEYYYNNLNCLLNVLKMMKKYNCNKFIFSSSATVYGNNSNSPISEDADIQQSTSPYGNTKIISEQIIKDFCISNKNFNTIILRYFNPIGAHKSGLIGDNPNGIPNNLLPYIMKVAIGKLEKLSVYGNDYNTKDGTCIRDYIHVVDLARNHINVINKLNNITDNNFNIYNFGSGIGYSVLDVINSFEKMSGIKIPHIITNRRSGDVEAIYSNIHKSIEELNFTIKYSLDDMCYDSWNYIINNK